MRLGSLMWPLILRKDRRNVESLPCGRRYSSAQNRKHATGKKLKRTTKQVLGYNNINSTLGHTEPPGRFQTKFRNVMTNLHMIGVRA